MSLFFRRAPKDPEVRAIAAARREAAFGYDGVGTTRERLAAAPAGFELDQYGAGLGEGDEVWRRGRAALQRLRNYPPAFTRVVWETEREAHEGALFATVASHFGFFSVHPCRVIFVVDEPNRFAVGFGTLPGHAELGEECFSLTRKDDGGVRYDVQAFSRPQGLARLGAPVARGLQRRFQRETILQMQAIARG